ncbi:hypothetical protein AQUCO_00400290v1 [Aquilegia coerulea]|uniref:Uncharacterized protein n=1 Tax=Aquilegia coerulea TaxID=218851 RepID=A0A2G5EU88_AQUCA|nr:hypothetical protein AQUCO_00400290v1 [Aquilegia coerulea]
MGDFSFPTIVDPIPRLEYSASLWRVPSEVSFDSCREDDGLDEGVDIKREVSEEEKMDMLWENFNDESNCNTSSGNKGLWEASVSSSSVMASNKKPSMLVISKVLRKLFLLQN